MNSERMKSRTKPADCERCQHFRPQASFVDAWKRYDRIAPYPAVMRSLQEIGKAETLENEIELLFDLVRAEEPEWPVVPRLAPYCAAKGASWVAALKNRDGTCPDFAEAYGRCNRSCRTCRDAALPQTYIGEGHEMITGGMSESERNEVKQRNREIDDTDATATALEIEQAFYGDGRMPVVKYLPTCAVKLSEGNLYTVPFSNLRMDCGEHSPFIRTPPSLLVDASAEPGSLPAEITAELAGMVAAAGQEGSLAFVREAREWLRKDSSRGSSVPWILRCILGRWMPKSKEEGEALMRELTTPEPLAGDKELSLLPVVAGADAFEWGLVAKMSRANDTAAENVAKAVVQQLSEYLSSSLRPLDATRCIEAAGRLLAFPALFAPRTRELLEPFLKRLDFRAEAYRYLARTDILGWYEAMVAGLSYPVGIWLRQCLREIAQLAKNPALGEADISEQRENLERKMDYAAEQGTRVLEILAQMDAYPCPPVDSRVIDWINQDNDQAVQRDSDEREAMIQKAMAWATAQTGIDLSSMVGGDMLAASFNTYLQRNFQSTVALEIPRRKVATALMFMRGSAPVTPSALELWGRPPSPHLPNNIEEAIKNPASKNLESFWPPQNQPTADYLRVYRRVGYPRLVAATASAPPKG